MLLIDGRTKAALFDSLNLNGFWLGLQDWFQIWFVASQVSVQRCHDLGALADRGGDALHRFCPRVADGENTPSRRFQGMPAGTRVVEPLVSSEMPEPLSQLVLGSGADKKK